MRIIDMGIKNQYGAEFTINRSMWIRDYLLLHFNTSCAIEFLTQKVIAPPNSVFIYHIGSRQNYHAVEERYSDDFIHFMFDDNRSLLDELNIPMLKVIPLPENDIIPELMKMMYEEFVSSNPYREKSIDKLFRLILYKISELSGFYRTNEVKTHYFALFQRIRSDIFLHPKEAWSVEKEAKRSGLSTPYFQKMYKAFFNTTFVNDVILSRIEKGKNLLLSTDKSVKEISIQCGYRNEPYFMRQFKNYMKMTPTQYRKKYRNVEKID